MSYTNDLETPVGEVRALIPDEVEGKMRFTDEKILFFLRLEGQNIKRATAQALEIIASSTAATASYIETNAIKLDGTKPADLILKRARMMREQSADPTPDAEDEEDEWGLTCI